MIKKTFLGIDFIKFGDIAAALVGHSVDDDSIGRFDTIEEVYDFFRSGDNTTYQCGNNDLTFIKLSRFVADYPFTEGVLDMSDLNPDSIYVLLEDRTLA